MKLFVDNNKDLRENIELDIDKLTLKNFKDYQGVYVPSMLSSILDKTLDKFDRKFEKYWKLDGVLYLADSDDEAVCERMELMEDVFNQADTLEDLNNEDFLNDLKMNINNQIENSLNKDSNLEKNQKEKILKDACKKVDDLVDSFAEKYFNDKVRDKLEKYQDRWDSAIEKKNYDLADSIAKQIRKIYRTGLYKDDELKVRCEKTLHMDDLLDYKREKGKNVELTELEMEVVDEMVEREQLKLFTYQLENALKK